MVYQSDKFKQPVRGKRVFRYIILEYVEDDN
jgi:hypothetical protein